MADAMNYEFLLRRIYQVGRYGKKNVDADVYRRLEHAAALLKTDKENIKEGTPRISVQKIEDLEKEYKIECMKIWKIIRLAIEDGINKYGHKFTENELHSIKEALKQRNEITKEHVDNAITVTESIFVKHKIFPS